MSQQNPKLVMMRFDPRAGWVQPSEERIEVDGEEAQMDKPQAASADPASLLREALPPSTAAKAPAVESLTELGASIVEVFNSLKLGDPRLEVWTQVNASIEKISEKINEQKRLEQKLHEVAIDIENLRNLTAQFVNHAYQNEVEIHATSKVRVQIAESLNQRIKNALKS
jgi:DNA repair ATPase RecN